jgi:hypothetical protein
MAENRSLDDNLNSFSLYLRHVFKFKDLWKDKELRLEVR